MMTTTDVHAAVQAAAPKLRQLAEPEPDRDGDTMVTVVRPDGTTAAAYVMHGDGRFGGGTVTGPHGQKTQCADLASFCLELWRAEVAR